MSRPAAQLDQNSRELIRKKIEEQPRISAIKLFAALKLPFTYRTLCKILKQEGLVFRKGRPRLLENKKRTCTCVSIKELMAQGMIDKTMPFVWKPCAACANSNGSGG
jgi:hypothetical protein